MIPPPSNAGGVSANLVRQAYQQAMQSYDPNEIADAQMTLQVFSAEKTAIAQNMMAAGRQLTPQQDAYFARIQNANMSLGARLEAASMLPGEDPAAQEAIDILSNLHNLEPESPRAMVQVAKLKQLQRERPDLAEGIEGGLKNSALRTLDQVLGALTTLMSRVRSPQTRMALENRINLVNLGAQAMQDVARMAGATYDTMMDAFRQATAGF